MSFARTYFLNQLSDHELDALLSRREDFFLENVVDMDGTLQLSLIHI